MIIYNSNATSIPFITQSTWTGIENQVWNAGNGNIYFNPIWFYSGSNIILSCDIEVKDLLPVTGKTLSDIGWNGGGCNSGNTSFWSNYPHGMPFRGYILLSSSDALKNGKYHFSKELIITENAISYVSTNQLLYQTLGWRLDYVASGSVTISNLLVVNKEASNCHISKNGNLTSINSVEEKSKSKIYTNGVYFDQFQEI